MRVLQTKNFISPCRKSKSLYFPATLFCASFLQSWAPEHMASAAGKSHSFSFAWGRQWLLVIFALGRFQSYRDLIVPRMWPLPSTCPLPIQKCICTDGWGTLASCTLSIWTVKHLLFGRKRDVTNISTGEWDLLQRMDAMSNLIKPDGAFLSC